MWSVLLTTGNLPLIFIKKIFSIDEPSPTVRGVNRPIPDGYPGHHGDTETDLSKVRPLTTLERARIQTFPPSFKLCGTKTNLEQAIGNAVPVNLAVFVGKALLDYEQQQTIASPHNAPLASF